MLGNAFIQSGMMGITCGLFGAFMGFAITVESEGEGFEMFWMCSGLASLLMGTFLWWLCVGRRDVPRVRRGALAGGLSAIGAHYLTFYFLILWQNILYWTKGTTSSLGEAPIDPIQGLWGAVTFTVFSYFIVGWFTIPFGATMGAAYAWLLKRLPT